MTTSHSIEINSLSSEPIVVKTATCKSISGKSTLTYHIACDSDNEVYFRVVENSGKGFFSCEKSREIKGRNQGVVLLDLQFTVRTNLLIDS